MDDRELVISALRDAGVTGLTRPKLLKAVAGAMRGTKAEKDASLRLQIDALAADGHLVNLGTDKTPRWILAEFDRRLDRACDTIISLAVSGAPKLFNAAALRKGHAKGIKRPMIDQAIDALVARRELIPLAAGKSIYYLHASAIAPLLSTAPAAVAPPPIGIRETYAALVREGGFADVPIDQLARRSGSLLPALKTYLLAEARAGRAAPTRGDWSLASAEARAAAIDVRGEPHLQIRLF